MLTALILLAAPSRGFYFGLRVRPLSESQGGLGRGWSPDGRRLSFLTEITGVPQVWEVSSEAPSWPEQFTFYEERISGALYSPTENGLLFGMDAGGNERSQLFLLEDGRVTDLTGAPDAIHYSGGFSPDGRRIAYTATRRNGTDFDVFVQELPDGEPEMVWEVSGYHTVADWAPDGRALIVSRHHSNVNNDLYRLNLETGEATLLTGHEGDARFSSANVKPDGGSLYLATDRDGEFLRLARLDLATLELEYLTPDDRDVEGVELSRDGRYLVASRNVDGYSDVLLFNGRGRRMPDPRIPEGIVGGFEFSPDSGRLAFTLTAPGAQPRRLGRRPTRRRGEAPYPLLDGRHPAPQLPQATGRALRQLRRSQDTGPLLPAGDGGRARYSERPRRAGEPVTTRVRPRDTVPARQGLRRVLP